MPFEMQNILLERIRHQYAEFKVKHVAVRLYAVIDWTVVPARLLQELDKALITIQRTSLYSNTGLDDLAKFGPRIIVVPEPDAGETQNLYQWLTTLNRQDHRIVTWIWATHEITPLIDHLQTLLHARFDTDGTEAWFFFYQANHLPILHSLLPDDVRRHVFGPLLAWWCTDVNDNIVELLGNNLALPTEWDYFPISAAVAEALSHASAPAQVLAWLAQHGHAPQHLDGINAELREVRALVERAASYSVTEKNDLGVYCAYAFQYGQNYDDHPALHIALKEFRAKPDECQVFRIIPKTLLETFGALPVHVWDELKQALLRKYSAAAVCNYRSASRGYGYTTVAAHIVNRTGNTWSQFEMGTVFGSMVLRSVLVEELPGSTFSDSTTYDLGRVEIPVPGEKARFDYSNRNGLKYTLDVFVTGELPRANGEGVAIVLFANDRQIYVHMYADAPDPLPKRTEQWFESIAKGEPWEEDYQYRSDWKSTRPI